MSSVIFSSLSSALFSQMPGPPLGLSVLLPRSAPLEARLQLSLLFVETN